jgi:hypothetical protein
MHAELDRHADFACDPARVVCDKKHDEKQSVPSAVIGFFMRVIDSDNLFEVSIIRITL